MTRSTPFAEILARRLSRRQTLTGIGAGAATVAAAGLLPTIPMARAAGASSLTFVELDHRIEPFHRVASGYDARVLIRWGDPILKGAPEFEPGGSNGPAQERQFGYNNDFIAYMPWPRGSQSADHGLLCVNHEYTDPQLMWPGIPSNKEAAALLDKHQVAVDMAAHGHSVVEIRRAGGRWQVVPDSALNRRIDASTPIHISGPAAGHPRMRTSADPEGRTVAGTVNCCAGGFTPWGTVLIAEENFHYYFGGKPADQAVADALAPYGLKEQSRYAWSRFHPRFDVSKEPNEPNRFGWVVEYDPYDPSAAPVKRTALGRFKHESASAWLDRSGHVVIYSGDDEVFQFLYRFVSSGKVDLSDPTANRDLLDEGVLSVARFDADGSLDWLPLVHGEGPLTAENGFESQADILIETRRAAALLGATPMDRPEDVEVNPVSGRIYAIFTNNKVREQPDEPGTNPRAPNPHGHVLELVPPAADGGLDHRAESFGWDVLFLAGNPNAEHGAAYHDDVSENGWLSSPDNCAFDPRGRMWIATDQGSAQSKNGIPDGLYGCDVEGPGRALTRFFFACPVDAELCGPAFTPDGRTLFVAVQHPGEAKGSTFESPSTRWPDFADGVPPRPSIVVIEKRDRGPIGS